MKKTVLTFGAIVGLVATSSAGVLYWTVNDSPSSVSDINENTPSSNVLNDFNNWNQAKLAYYGEAVTKDTFNNSGEAMTISPAEKPNIKETVVGRDQATSDFAFDTSSGSYSSGVFYIELYNNNTLVGRSKEYLTYDSAKQTFTSSNGTDVFDGQLSFFDGIQTWNGGSAYVAVPEPTSGVMLLLGAALLGLRRRRA